MDRALAIAKTGLDGQQTRLAVISNNLANVNTTGFKRGRVSFSDLLYQTVRQPGAQSSQSSQLPSGLMLGTGVRVVATSKLFAQGNVDKTNAELDVAVQGKGFLQILLPDGTVAYTRDGQLQKNANGEIVTAEGNLLEPAITLPDNVQSLTIGSDGVVSVLTPGAVAPQTVGNIQLAGFVNPAGLQPVGDNLFVETAASGAPQTGTPGENGLGTLVHGALESSNVNVVEELVNMIETQRAYEMNSKAIDTADQMLQFASQTL